MVGIGAAKLQAYPIICQKMKFLTKIMSDIAWLCIGQDVKMFIPHRGNEYYLDTMCLQIPHIYSVGEYKLKMNF